MMVNREASSPTIVVNRFTIFAILFSFASFIHHLLQAYVWFPQILGQVYFLAALITLFHPNSLYCFSLLMLAAATKLFISVPWLPNHLVFECLVLSSICFILVFSFLYRREVAFNQESLLAKIAPVVRSYLVIMYFFTFLAKLNRDFLIPEYSCGVVMLNSIIHNYSWINWSFLGSWGQLWAIWGTIIVEVSLPILLIFPRTRNVGVVIGFLFHFMMGSVLQEPICSFSGMSYVFLLFFLDERTVNKMGEIIGNIVSYFRKPIVWKMGVGGILYGLWFLKYKAILKPEFTCGVWFTFSAVIAVLYGSSLYLAYRQKPILKTDESIRDFFLPNPRFFIILVIPLVINGALPYFGLKTQGSLTMFSNLGIFGAKHNHLVFPSSMKVHEEELIKVLESDHGPLQEYVGKPYLLPKFEFRYFASQMPDGKYVTFLHQGQARTLNKGEDKDELFIPISSIKRKLIRFKPEDEREHTYCTW